MNGLQQTIYDASRVLLWPVLIAALVCLVWVLIEFGFFLYELYLRFRYRDLDALEARTLRTRKAFQDGKPRTAYRYLQENNYSIVVARFLFDLIRNYQTERLAAKPLKLLQEYEFYTIKRLERTRILVRVGPILGLMGTLIPLSPALMGLASGNTTQLAENLTTAFSVTVIGLLIGGTAFVISIVRDRMYSQDISDMEYLLELLEGGTERLHSGRRRNKNGIWDADPVVEYEALVEDGDAATALPVLLETPREPLIPFASGDGGEITIIDEPPAVVVAPAAAAQPAAPQPAVAAQPAAAEAPRPAPTSAFGRLFGGIFGRGRSSKHAKSAPAGEAPTVAERAVAAAPAEAIPAEPAVATAAIPEEPAVAEPAVATAIPEEPAVATAIPAEPAATTPDPLAAEAAPPVVRTTPAAGEAPPLTFDDPAMDWQRDEDPFADLGPVDPRPPAGGASAPGAGTPPASR